MRPGDAASAKSVDAFAVAAMENATSEPPTPKRRAPTLFERMTGAGRARAQREEPQTSRVAPELKAETTPATPQQPSLEGLESQARTEPSAADAELLEIPAFLRRQAN